MLLQGRTRDVAHQGEATFTLKDHREATEGVECRKDQGVIDETPMAYKDIDAVIAAQSDLIDVVHTLKQVVLCDASPARQGKGIGRVTWLATRAWSTSPVSVGR